MIDTEKVENYLKQRLEGGTLFHTPDIHVAKGVAFDNRLHVRIDGNYITLHNTLNDNQIIKKLGRLIGDWKTDIDQKSAEGIEQ